MDDFSEKPPEVYFIYETPPEATTVVMTRQNHRAFEFLKNKNVNPLKLSASKIAKIPDLPQNVYVVESFDEPFINQLQRRRCRIVSPLAFLYVQKHGTPISNREHPIFSQCMRQFIVTTTGFSREENSVLCNKINQMQGRYEEDLRAETTFLVSNTVLTKKYQTASKRRIPVLSAKWVYDCFDKFQYDIRFANDETIFKEYSLPLFHNLRFSVSGVAHSERDKLKALVESHGGSYNPMLLKDASVLLSDGTQSTKCKFAYEKSIPVVKIAWLHDSIMRGYSLPMQHYLLTAEDLSAPKPKGASEAASKVRSEKVEYEAKMVNQVNVIAAELARTRQTTSASSSSSSATVMSSAARPEVRPSPLDESAESADSFVSNSYSMYGFTNSFHGTPPTQPGSGQYYEKVPSNKYGIPVRLGALNYSEDEESTPEAKKLKKKARQIRKSRTKTESSTCSVPSSLPMFNEIYDRGLAMLEATGTVPSTLSITSQAPPTNDTTTSIVVPGSSRLVRPLFEVDESSQQLKSNDTIAERIANSVLFDASVESDLTESTLPGEDSDSTNDALSIELQNSPYSLSFLLVGFSPSRKTELTARIRDMVRANVLDYIDANFDPTKKVYCILENPNINPVPVLLLSIVAAGMLVIDETFVEDLLHGDARDVQEYQWFHQLDTSSINQASSQRLLNSLRFWRRFVDENRGKVFHDWQVMVLQKTDAICDVAQTLHYGGAKVFAQTDLKGLSDRLHSAEVSRIDCLLLDVDELSRQAPKNPEFFKKIVAHFAKRKKLFLPSFISDFVLETGRRQQICEDSFFDSHRIDIQMTKRIFSIL